MIIDTNLQPVTEATVAGGYIAGRSFLGWEEADAGQHLADRQAVRAADGRVLADGEWLVDSATSAEFVVLNGRIREPGLYGLARQSATSDWLPGQLAGFVYLDADHAEMVWLEALRAAEAAKPLQALQARINRLTDAQRDALGYMVDAFAEGVATLDRMNRKNRERFDRLMADLSAELDALSKPAPAAVPANNPFGALAGLRR